MEKNERVKDVREPRDDFSCTVTVPTGFLTFEDGEKGKFNRQRSSRVIEPVHLRNCAPMALTNGAL